MQPLSLSQSFINIRLPSLSRGKPRMDLGKTLGGLRQSSVHEVMAIRRSVVWYVKTPNTVV